MQSNSGSPPQELIGFRLGTPLTDAGQDELGRLPFALSLARALKNQPPDQALVLAVCGDWGSGKSSTLALVRQSLETQPIEKGERVPVWLPFNPWQWNGADSVIAEYFQVLATAVEELLNETSEAEQGQGRFHWPWLKRWNKTRQRAALTAKQIRVYGSRFAVHSVFLQGYSSLIAGVTGLFALFAAAGYIVEREDVTLSFTVVGTIIVAFLAFSKWGAEAAEKLAAAHQAQQDAAARSPRATKEELSDKLRALPRPILVVMDDLDRLTADEIAAVFQLVKAQADFPNVFYLLAFSRSIVENSLERVAPGIPGNGLPAGAGREFLEKIVPVLFDLPMIDAGDIERLLRRDIEKILRISFAEDQIRARWTDLWDMGLKAFFETVRDIERFVNGLSFGAQLLRGDDELEVDTCDLIVIETLRLFEPAFYNRLSHASEEFTDNDLLGLAQLIRHNDHGREPSRDVKAERRQFLGALLKEVSEPHREPVRQLLRRLFPGVEDCLRQPGDKSVSHIERDHASRVSDQRYFSRYFRYALGPDEWSQAEVKDLLLKASDRAAFISYLHEVGAGKIRPKNARGAGSTLFQSERDAARLLSDLVRLADNRIGRTETLSSNDAKNLAIAVFDAGNALPELSTRDLSRKDFETEFSEMAHSVLIHIEDEIERDRITLEALQETTGYAAPAIFVLEEGHRHEKAKNFEPDFSKFSIFLSCLHPQSLKTAQRMAVQKLEDAAQRGSLWQENRLKNYLYLWRDWGDDASKAHMNDSLLELVAEDRGILWLLQGFLMSHSNSTFGDGAPLRYRSWDVSPAEIEQFVPLDLIRAALPRLQQHIEQTLKSLPVSTSLNDIAPRLYREWTVIHLMQRALQHYDQGSRESFTNDLPEHTVLQEFEQVWRKLKHFKFSQPEQLSEEATD